MTKPYASLARVTTPAQAKDERYGIPTQLSTNRAYAGCRGFKLGGEYVDQVSGVSESREAFYRLLAEAEQYAGVIVYDVSRIGRDEELSHRFLRLMWEAALEIHSSTRGILVEPGLATSAEIMVAAEARRNILRTTLNSRIQMAKKGKLQGGHHPLRLPLGQGRGDGAP